MTYLYIDLMSVEMNGYIHVDTKYSNKEILSCGMHYKGASFWNARDITIQKAIVKMKSDE